jgi:hypothetical protein
MAKTRPAVVDTSKLGPDLVEPEPAGDVVIGVPVRSSKAFPLRRLDGHLALRQAVALRATFSALVEEQATLPYASVNRPRDERGGVPVARPLDAVRWLLERVADEMGLDAVGRPAK